MLNLKRKLFADKPPWISVLLLLHGLRGAAPLGAPGSAFVTAFVPRCFGIHELVDAPVYVPEKKKNKNSLINML